MANQTIIYKCPTSYTCDAKKAGTLLLPIFNESDWSTGVRAFLYGLGMLWSFMGVSIGADLFMCAIETITSKTKKIKYATNSEDGKGYEEMEVRVWNDTVANLTLMALGSSAPEILLSIIEIVGNNFKAGELGPGTIVGSAAFNLLIITAVCLIGIPEGQTRRIRSYKVFAVTAFFSIFAYLWLVVVLKANTANVVDVWEAVITFLMFPILVILAFIADKDYCGGKIDSSKKKDGIELGITESEVPELQHLGSMQVMSEEYLQKNHPEVVAFMKEVTGNPRISEKEAAKLIAMRIEASRTKNYGYYRVGALRNFGGGRKVVPQVDPKLRLIYDELADGDLSHASSRLTLVDLDGAGIPKATVQFAATSCAVLESDKVAKLGVVRTGNTKMHVTVHYETIDGTAEAGSDYIAKKELLQFRPDETHKYIDIIIIDDNEWEPDETFFVKLHSDPSDDKTVIGKHSIAEVTIINDDEPGEISFTKPSFIFKESCGKAELQLERVNGADGKVEVKWKTRDQSAVNEKDYIGGEGVLTFDHGETVKSLEIEIIDDHTFEKDETFMVILSDPSAGARLGRLKSTVVTIVNDDDYRKMFDRVVSLTHANLHKFSLGAGTWGQQFEEALSVNGGDTENASTADYIMHFVTFAWKVIFAIVPPASWLGGWLAFVVCLAMIGILTAIIGDLASVFGCLVGLKKEVTAFTFVALGTSLPDLFASKVAATNEKYADASIGNVTGSNSVNVFLGLGTPWLIASIYWAVKDGKFEVPAGTLSISVITYAVCAIICISVLVLRRFLKPLGKAELGGPKAGKYITGISIASLWFVYVLISALVSYDHIKF